MNIRKKLEQLEFRRFIPILSLGLVLGAIDLPTVISFAVLIYSGELAPFAGAGIGMVLFGGLVLQLVVALTTSVPGIMGGPQDSPAAILGIMAASILAQTSTETLETRFITVAVTIMLTSVLSGLFFWMMGVFKLGRFVRFIPYPVVGGFIAGTGLLLLQGAFGVMTGITPALASLDLLLTPQNLLRWIPGVVLGVALVWGSRRYPHFLTIPIILTITAIIFYATVWAGGFDLVALRADGWLLGPFPEGSLWQPLDLSLLPQVNWMVIAQQASNMAAIALISMVALLLNSNALELVAKTDIDLNRELMSTGLANMAGGLLGSTVGYHYLGFAAIPFRMNIQSRWIAILAAAVTGFVLLAGASLLSLIPMLMAGGVLFFLGITFLTEWLYDAWFQLPRMDYALVVLILLVIGTLGFLEGVGTGIAIAIVLFVVNYSRIDIIKDSLTGNSYQSSTERPFEHRQLIKRLGEKIEILRLHGFVFFGTAQGLVMRISERLKSSANEELRYLILDFQHVSALDSSAVFSFVRLQQLAETNQFHLVFTDLDKHTRLQLVRAGLHEEHDLIHFFTSMDYGMEWCESKLLLEEGGSTITRAASLRSQLKRLLPSAEHVERFMTYLERQEVQQYHIVIARGDAPDSMYFIDSGQLTTRLDIAKGKFIRLRKQGGGTMVGEMGLFLNQARRTATVVADEPSVLYRLSIDAYNRMMHDDPEVAFHLHQWIGRVLSVRLAENNSTLEALLS
jgi:sulfate permease, SulP family